MASSPCLDQALVDDVEHLEKRHVGRHAVGDIVGQPTRLGFGPAWRQIFRFNLKEQTSANVLFVASLRRMHLLEHERFLVQLRLPADAFELPGRHV